MFDYVVRRLLYAIPTLLGITLLIFFILRVLPGDPLVVLYGEGGANSMSHEDRAAIRHKLGFDRPLYQQYGSWLKDLLTGNLGHTLARGDSVAEIIRATGRPHRRDCCTGGADFLAGRAAGRHPQRHAAKQRMGLHGAFPYHYLPGSAELLGRHAGGYSTFMVFNYRPPLGIIYPWDNLLANLKIVAGAGHCAGPGISAYIARLSAPRSWR